jgi:hypothetical protein
MEAQKIADVDAELAEIETDALDQLEAGDEIIVAQGHYESGEWRIQQHDTVERVGIAPGALPPSIGLESGNDLLALNNGSERRLFVVA